MSISKQLAKHLRDIHFGGNWSEADLKTTLSDVHWEDAQTQVYSLNSIAALVVHMTYYVEVLIIVLEDNKMTGKDELSWILPVIQSKKDWDELLEGIWQRAEKAASLIEELPDEQLTQDFIDPKYGTKYRNIAGIIEHMHYHLGQIVIIKKLVVQ